MAKRPNSRPRMMKEKKEFEEEVLQVDRVTRVVKGGRRLRFRATVIIGNRRGKVGIGIGKSTEVSQAIKKAVTKAKKNIIQVPMVKETIPFEIKSKFKASIILMIPASEGTGIKAGSSTRKILEMAGVNNILAKSLGSNNRINLAKATMKALHSLYEKELPEEALRVPKEKKQVRPPQQSFQKKKRFDNGRKKAAPQDKKTTPNTEAPKANAAPVKTEEPTTTPTEAPKTEEKTD
ncbi:MAG: 30S ribosomal protein S5 [Candidatus Gracilibacteria bacterium]|nr:30S ribosomal protein S5 [Candidatus Gracilibacteria bacterium]